MKKILLIMLIISQPLFCLSDPLITDVSITTTLTITGTGFGIKSPAAPIDFWTFEEGSNGNVLSRVGWTNTADGGATNYPQYSSTRGYGGSSISMLANPLNGSVKSATGYDNGDLAIQNLYITYNSYKAFTTHASYFTKLMRLQSWAGGGIGLPEFFLSHLNESKTITFFNESGNAACTGCGMYNVDYQFDKWTRDEVYVESGTQGNADASWAYSNHNIGVAINTYGVSNATLLTGSARLSYFTVGRELDTGQQHYIDNLYIDNTQARVEIGDASTWESCTHREIQIPSAWSTSSITVTINEGSFSTVVGEYLYVIDADGVVSDTDTGTAGTQGYLITDAVTPNITGLKSMNGGALH